MIDNIKKIIAGIMAALIALGGGVYVAEEMRGGGDPSELVKVWDVANKTVIIGSDTGVPVMTVRLISSEPDLCTFTEIFEVTNFKAFTPHPDKDFKARTVKHAGKGGVQAVEWFIEQNIAYTVNITDYKIIQVEKVIYNNETGKNKTILVNETVIAGYHDETRYKDVWHDYKPHGKPVSKDSVQRIKVVYHKLPEVGDVSIQTIPMFRGVECDELTWWNTSWDHKREIKINNTGGSALTYYQVNVNLTSTPINSTSLRVVNETADATVPHWQETISSGNCTDLWFNVTSIPASAWLNDTYYMYYGNVGAASDWNGTNTFLAFVGDGVYSGMTKLNADKADVFDMTTNPGFLTIDPTTDNTRLWYSDFAAPFIYKNISGDFLAETKVTSNRDANYEADALIVGDFLPATKNWFGLFFKYDASFGGRTKQAADTVNSVSTPINTAFDYAEGYIRITKVGTTYTSYYKQAAADSWALVDNKSRTFSTVNVGIGSNPGNAAGNIVSKYYYFIVRKYAATEPTATIGVEEDPFSITSYAPATPLSKTEGDSQTFNVTASESCQCRWYIDGTLVQTNSTPSTTHAYTNTSLALGANQNFSACVNNSTLTDMQTWDVTVSAAGTFQQSTYIDYWQYVTNLNNTGRNFSQFFSQMSAYYLVHYNKTAQRTYGYNSTRWTKYESYNIPSGDVAMLRYASNDTITRDNAGGTFSGTLKTGLNQIGHSYNGTRNLTWYNTTIASSNVSTITHSNPVTGATHIYTYGSSANGTVDVLQGFGVEVSVSADTAFSGI